MKKGISGLQASHPEHSAYYRYPVQDIVPPKLRPAPEIMVWLQRTVTLYGTGLQDIHRVKSPDHYFHITYISFTSAQSVATSQDLQLYSGSNIIGPRIIALGYGDTERIIPDKIPLIAKNPGDALRVNITGSVGFIDCFYIGWESPVRYQPRYPIR